MRALLALAPLALFAAPALAQQQPARPAKPTAEQELQRALADPATADKLARMMQALSGAFLNLPVGELEAAVEGRPVTAADRGKTVLSAGREGDPNFERDFRAQMANSKPIIQSSLKALATSLPAMMKGLGQMSDQLDKAVENMPRPNYPKQ